MKRRVIVLFSALMLSLPGCMTTSPPAEMSSPEPLYGTTTYHIRHTALDPQGRRLSAFIETPVFAGGARGLPKDQRLF